MGLISKVGDFFGLDIGTTSLRVVQLRNTGAIKTLARYGYAPLEANITESEMRAHQQKLAQTIRELIGSAGINTKNVAVGLPSSRVFTTVVDIDHLPNNEIDKAIKFQADSLIPMPLAESKVDWAVVGNSPQDQNKIEVLISSVSNEFVEARLDMLESIGLNVIAFEPDNLAMTRSVIATGDTSMHMLLDIGNKSTDLVVALDGAPRLTRSIPTGSEALIRAATQNLGIDQKQAEQFVFKFGLNKDKLEGQIYSAIINTVDILMGEIEKSIKFMKTRYPNNNLEHIIVTGGASALPEFPLYIANKFGYNVEIGNAWRNVAFAPERQNELLSISNHFAVAVGLAERNE